MNARKQFEEWIIEGDSGVTSEQWASLIEALGDDDEQLPGNATFHLTALLAGTPARQWFTYGQAVRALDRYVENAWADLSPSAQMRGGVTFLDLFRPWREAPEA